MPRPDDIRLYFQTITAKQARQLLANHRWNGQPVDHVRIIIEYIYIYVCVCRPVKKTDLVFLELKLKHDIIEK